MTIKEFLIKVERKNFENRLLKLEQFSAPEVMITAQKNQLENFEDTFKVGGDEKLLDVEYKNHQKCVGNGGKIYITFNDCINYFPQAKYGRFITEKNK